MKGKNKVKSDMLYCKKCERFRGHYIYSNKYVCCGCEIETAFDLTHCSRCFNLIEDCSCYEKVEGSIN